MKEAEQFFLFVYPPIIRQILGKFSHQIYETNASGTILLQLSANSQANFRKVFIQILTFF